MKKLTKIILGSIGGTLVLLIVLFSTVWIQATHNVWSLIRIGAIPFSLLAVTVVLAVKLTDAAGKESSGDLGDPSSAEPNPGEGTDTEVPVTGKPISEMTPDELKALADTITSELAKRATQG